ncbi:MAG: leucine-rich repeat protein [Erysipelotrichaceae bacterium]
MKRIIKTFLVMSFIFTAINVSVLAKETEKNNGKTSTDVSLNIEVRTGDTTFVDSDFTYQLDTATAFDRGSDTFKEHFTAETWELTAIPYGAILTGFSDAGKAKIAANGGILNIPDTIEGVPVTVISRNAFSGLNLTSVSMPDSVLYLDFASFRDNKIESLKLSSNIIFINESSFENSIYIKELVLPDTLKSIEYQVFAFSINLETVVFPPGLEYIGERAFIDCDKLSMASTADNAKEKTLSIPGSLVGGLGLLSFQNTGFSFFEIEEGVTSVVSAPFWFKNGLKVATFPSTIEEINYTIYKIFLYNAPWYGVVNNMSDSVKLSIHEEFVQTFSWSADRLHQTEASFTKGKGNYYLFTGDIYANYDVLAVELEEEGLLFSSGNNWLAAKSLMTKSEFLEFLNDEQNDWVKEGYTFVGWDTTGFDTGVNAAAWEELPIPVNARTSGVFLVDNIQGIKPIFEKNIEKFTVTFQDFDGTVLDTQTINAGEAAVEPSAPTRSGYEFTGWDVDFSNITADLVVTAQYKEIIETLPETGIDSTMIYVSALALILAIAGLVNRKKYLKNN